METEQDRRNKEFSSLFFDLFGSKNKKNLGKISLDNIWVDIKKINSLVDARLSGQLSDIRLITLRNEISQIVIQAILERRLYAIADDIRTEFKLKPADVNYKGRLKGSLHKAYADLGLDSKNELMPLFFNPYMDSEESIYLPEKEVRDASFSDYLALVEKEGLSIHELKIEYISTHRYRALLPLKDKLDIPE